MSERRGSLLPQLELLFFIALFLAFGLWGVRQCNRTRERFRERSESEQLRQLEDSLSRLIESRKDSARRAPSPTPSAPPSPPVLYVSIQGLKVRPTPSLNGEPIETLNLYDQVYFLGEVTDSVQTINLGKQLVSEPWVKIQTPRGRAGWVFGAGVHYYKRKHPGAE
jgi:Bacterial SH3 domain